MRVETIGDATLYLGDCMEILPTLPKVDAVITDPPYGLGFPYLSHDDTKESLDTLIAGFVPACIEHSRVTAISCGITNLQRYPEADWTLAVTWNTTGSHGMFGFNQWMAVLLYGKDLKRPEGILKSDVIAISGSAFVGYHRGDEKEHHPCPKPLGVMERLVARLSEGAVLDPFMGSGTTGVACVNLRRPFVGIEKEPRYFDIACRRIEQAAKQGQLFQPQQAQPEQLSIT